MPRARSAVSARIDGEDEGDAAALDRHLGGCASCRSFSADAVRLGRAVRQGAR